MLKKKRKLVKILSESTEQLWNSEQLAGLLHTSQRTVLRYIKELKEEEEKRRLSALFSKRQGDTSLRLLTGNGCGNTWQRMRK